MINKKVNEAIVELEKVIDLIDVLKVKLDNPITVKQIISSIIIQTEKAMDLLEESKIGC